MFWGKDKKGKQKTSKKASVEAVRKQAMANVRAARENIGEDTLDRIAAAMKAKQNSATEQAKDQIAKQDAERVVFELRQLIEDS